MRDRSPRAFARRLPRPLRALLGLALLAAGCSPEGVTSGDVKGSKVPEIAKRRQHMEDMMKKAESKGKPPANSR